MNRELVIGQRARETLVANLKEVAEAVGSTMGPGGRPFGYDKAGIDGHITSTWSKDGLTVLRALRSDSPAMQAVLQYARQAGSHSVLASGDGSTSTLVLAAAVAKAIMATTAAFPQAFARELERDAKAAVEAIRREAIPATDDIARTVAVTSANGDKEIADVTMKALGMSGAYGTLLIEKNPSAKERYKISKQAGYSQTKGYLYNMNFAQSASPVTASFKPIEWEKPLVALINGSLTSLKQLETTLSAWDETKNLVVFTHDVHEAVTDMLIGINRRLSAQGKGACFVVTSQYKQEVNFSLQVMRDYAAYCGIPEEKIIDVGNIQIVDSTFFGTCQKIEIGLNATTLLGRADNHWVEERIKQNQSIIDAARTPWDAEHAASRLAELSENLVRIEVGLGHLGELQERADRLDDSVKAAQACLKNGALPGGGCSYIRAGLLAGVHPALAEAFRSVHNNVLLNYGVQPNAEFIPLPGKTIYLDNDTATVVDAVEANVLDAADTVAACIANGVTLGISCALVGGFCFRQQGE